MSPVVTWGDVILRLFVSLLAGAAIGVNRGGHGKPAGLRTTMLVCLAGSIAMILSNFLLMTIGKATNSFVHIDPMRLPLGVLTGVGFIGAGAIIQRSEFVLGVTTAATLWFVTIIGLCIGAGQIALGVAATGLGLFVLWGLSFADRLLPRDLQATLTVASAGDSGFEEQLMARLRAGGYVVAGHTVALSDSGRRRESCFALRWRGRLDHVEPPEFLAESARRDGVLSLRWEPAVGHPPL